MTGAVGGLIATGGLVALGCRSNLTPMRVLPLTLLLIVLFGLSPARASYLRITRDTAQPQEVIVFDARYPYWTDGTYIATYPQDALSKEGWRAQYYGGVVTERRTGLTLLQYASWQMAGKGAPTSGIDFVHAGPHMSWKRSNWEGSSGGIKGKWPDTEFKPNQWYRFVHRVWTSTSPSPGEGFAGVWMKSLETGEWFHLATFKFPAELTGFNYMGGFHERFTPRASLKSAMEVRNSYARRSGQWTSESEFNASSAKDDTVQLTLSGDKRSVLMETTANEIDPSTGRPKQGEVSEGRRVLEQPSEPDFFDPIAVESVTPEIGVRRVVVRWKMGAKSSPQLGYQVSLLDGERVVATEKRNDPEKRLCVFDLPTAPRRSLQARLQINDVFGNSSAPVTVKVPRSVSQPALGRANSASGTLGLTYKYFETTQSQDWRKLPDFSKLNPTRQGAVATPDITPRLRREGYALEFTGFLMAPEDALYTFSLTGASGMKLLLDDRLVIDADGYRSIAHYSEALSLRAGLHAFRLLYVQGPKQSQQPDDFLQLSWSKPGSPECPIPAEAFRRRAEPQDPRITVVPVSSTDASVTLSCKLNTGTHRIERVEYYGENPSFDYFAWQGGKTLSYLLATVSNATESVTAPIWSGTSRTVRARLVYDGNRTVDSAPVVVTQKAARPEREGYRLSPLEHHSYPVAVEHSHDEVKLVGESMGLYTRVHTGDVTLIAHLKDITRDEATPDGSRPVDAANWFSGIILRANVNARPGEPLGGRDIPFSAIMGASSGATRHCDSTMIDGAGNQPSGTIGSNLKWMKLVRRGGDITTYASSDGTEWKTLKTVNFPKLPDQMEIGFVHYSIPSATPIVHHAVFDHIRVGQ